MRHPFQYYWYAKLCKWFVKKCLQVTGAFGRVERRIRNYASGSQLPGHWWRPPHISMRRKKTINLVKICKLTENKSWHKLKRSFKNTQNRISKLIKQQLNMFNNNEAKKWINFIEITEQKQTKSRSKNIAKSGNIYPKTRQSTRKYKSKKIRSYRSK